jgi:hypothetical protein
MPEITLYAQDVTGSAEGRDPLSGTAYGTAWDNTNTNIRCGDVVAAGRIGIFLSYLLYPTISFRSIINSATLSFLPSSTGSINTNAASVDILPNFTATMATNIGALIPDVSYPSLAWSGPFSGWTINVRNANSQINVITIVQFIVNRVGYGLGGPRMNIRIANATTSLSNVRAYTTNPTESQGPRLVIDYTPAPSEEFHPNHPTHGLCL